MTEPDNAATAFRFANLQGHWTRSWALGPPEPRRRLAGAGARPSGPPVALRRDPGRVGVTLGGSNRQANGGAAGSIDPGGGRRPGRSSTNDLGQEGQRALEGVDFERFADSLEREGWGVASGRRRQFDVAELGQADQARRPENLKELEMTRQRLAAAARRSRSPRRSRGRRGSAARPPSPQPGGGLSRRLPVPTAPVPTPPVPKAVPETCTRKNRRPRRRNEARPFYRKYLVSARQLDGASATGKKGGEPGLADLRSGRNLLAATDSPTGAGSTGRVKLDKTQLDGALQPRPLEKSEGRTGPATAACEVGRSQPRLSAVALPAQPALRARDATGRDPRVRARALEIDPEMRNVGYNRSR